MKKYVLGLVVFLMALFCVSQAIAGTDIWNVGTHKIDSTGAFSVTSSGSTLDNYKVIATTDTIASTDSGKTLIVTPVSATGGVITLPTATVGRIFTFIDGKSSPGTAYTFSVDPYSTEIIRYSISGATFTAGQKITSTGATGDSLTLVCGATGVWYVKDMKGSWTNGG